MSGYPISRLAAVIVAVRVLAAASAAAQTPTSGAGMYGAWCARCHADDGTGRGAAVPSKIPPIDFTDCRAASPESDADWRLVIARGGPAAGLSPDMPAFESLSAEQIEAIVKHLRGLCQDASWPRGTLNLPKALFTAKAFPDGEISLQPAVSHSRGDFTREHLTSVFSMRLGARGHAEFALPAESLNWVTGRITGIGDVAIEASYVVASRPSKSWLASVGLEVQAPTGNRTWGFGESVPIYSPFLATATIWRGNFVQTELRLDWPTRQVEREENHRLLVYNLALSRDLGPEKTAWNLGLELNGANTAIAVTPQVRKGLTRTGSLAAALGVQLPIRSLYHKLYRTFVWSGYLLWDYGESRRRRL